MSALVLDAPTIGAYAYALINPLQVDKAAWTDLPCTAVVPHAYREQPHLFPRLVELKKIDAAQHSNLIARNQQWIEAYGTAYFCALLKTELSAEGLRAYLARQMYQYHHARREYDVIRLHDPRVFRHFRWLLSNQQWDTLLGPIDSWAWPEPNGSWLVRDHFPAPGSYHAGRPWLAEKQWQSLLRLDEINGSLMHLTRVAPELIDDEALAKQIDALVVEARENHGLVDKADRRCYVEQVLRFHPAIHRHPQMHARLEQARAGEMEYVQACADLDEPTMRRFVTELSLGQGS